MRNQLLLPALLGAAGVSARDIPSNVKSFVDSLKSKGSCSNKLATGFYAKDEGPNTFSYCGDHRDDYNIIYIQGNNGAFADMDVDCDGIQNGPSDDGRCEWSEDTQAITSFQWILEGYNKGVEDLNAFVHPYIVFGNEGTKSGWKTFNPQDHGIKPLSVIAVVCNNQLFYGVWGDENGDDGPKPMVGEASISLATACFGSSDIDGNHGHDATDVLYIAFPGDDAVPGANGANWGASSWQSFEASIEGLGNSLIQRIGGGGGGGGGTDPTEPGECSWPGHCLGAACSTHNDCSDPYACINGKCGIESSGGGGSTPNYSCEWEGHCEGVKCATHNDCSDPLSCDATEKVCTMDGCDWAGHCLGAPCASHNDCSDPYECNASVGYCWHKAE